MIIKTNRLTIRNICTDDLEHLLEMNNNYNVMKDISTLEFYPSSAERELKGIKKQQSYYKDNTGFGLWMIDNEFDTIGWISLKLNPEIKEYELGYRLKEKYWRKGYTTEAGLKILEYAQTKGIKKVNAVALERNIGSTSLMKKIGMTFSRYDFLYGEHVVVYDIKL